MEISIYISTGLISQTSLACMTLDDFKQDFKSRARDSLPSDEIDFVNYTYKYISDENNVYLEYETHYVPSESGYVPLPRKDKSYLKKIDGLWYIDLQYEMDLLGPYLEYELGTEKPCLLIYNVLFVSSSFL
jgi:hypothetical protein